jgi:hypothetical protein
MGFDDIWKQLLAKKPALADDEAVCEFKAASLRRLLRQVYDQGYERGKEQMGTINGLFDNLFQGNPRK